MTCFAKNLQIEVEDKKELISVIPLVDDMKQLGLRN